MAAMWTIGPVAYLWIQAWQGRMDYFQELVEQEGIYDNPTAGAFAWLVLAFSAFIIGAALARRPTKASAPANWSEERAFRALLLSFVGVASVAFLWMGVAISQVGIGQMIYLAGSENFLAREMILSATFPGGRIVSNGFIATAIFSSFLLSKRSSAPLPMRTKLTFILILIFSLLYLGLAPILISGRINFFAAIIACYITACIARRRFVALAFMPIIIVLMASVWTAKQYFSLSHITDATVFTQAWEGFLFYIYNDFINAVSVIGNLDGNYTYGYSSARFIFFFTFTDAIILDFIRPNVLALGQYQGGGEFPLLTSPYVDFGFLGLLMLVLIGTLAKSLYYRARQDSTFGSVYGLVFAGLVLSLHSSYVTLQDSVFNIGLLLVLIRFSKNPVSTRVSVNRVGRRHPGLLRRHPGVLRKPR